MGYKKDYIELEWKISIFLHEIMLAARSTKQESSTKQQEAKYWANRYAETFGWKKLE